MSTICELLASDLVASLGAPPDGAPRRVLLWLDPEAHFARLMPAVESALVGRGLRLLQYVPEAGGGQLALKLALLKIEAAKDERAVVYLPGCARGALQPQQDGSPPTLWSAYDYRFKGRVWGFGEHWQPGEVPEPPTLLTWLTGHGLVVADDKTAKALVAGGEESLLARYAERRKDVPLGRWPCPLRLSDVHDALAGDARESLRALFAAPTNEVNRWGSERPLVLKSIASRYGLAVLGENGDADALADAFAIQLALIEAWDSFGRPTDFPFLAKLPTVAQQRESALKFLREDVLKHTDLGPRFRERVRRLESEYDLVAWAGPRLGQPAAMPRLALARWKGFLQRLAEASQHNWKEARDLVLAEQSTITAGAAYSWDGLQGETLWKLLADLRSLADNALKATAEASALHTPASFVRTYAAGWWQIDWAHLRIRELTALRPDLHHVRDVADHAYFEYVARVNDDFSAVLEASPHWPIAGTTAASSLGAQLWRVGGRRRAVILSDALRWDLAQQVAASRDPQATLSPLLAVLPSETAFGMATTLPLANAAVKLDFPAGKPAITTEDGINLSTRDGRKLLLESRLKDDAGKCAVQFLDLDALLRGAVVPKAPIIVVFDNDIDEQGHKIPDKLPPLAQQLVADLRRAIDLLHAAGIARVDVVTDHGFLLLPPDDVAALGSPKVEMAQCYCRSRRWALLKPDSPATEVLRFPLPLGLDNAAVGVPRGVRTLEKPQAYDHGGASLQECVIPHIVSEVVLAKAKIGLDLRVPTTQLSTGTVPVVLRPAPVKGQTSLGGFEPLRVRIWIETATEGASPKQVTKPLEQELRPEVEELKLALFLQDGLGLQAGQQLVLRALDAETERDLGKIPLRLNIDWD